MRRAEKFLVYALGLQLAFSSPRAIAQQPLLQITTPANASLATEGTTVNITVSADPSVQNVSVIAQIPLPQPQAGSSANQFTLTLPTTIPPGLYNLTAVGTNASGDVESAPVAIDVEPQYLGGISIVPTVLTLNSVDDQYPLRVIGTYSNGTTLDVTQSTQLSYSSYNTQIATVSSSGMITAVAAGQTFIVVQENGSTAAAAYVTIPPQPATGTPPAITSVTPTSGVPGVTQVTVTGSGFGATQGNGFVQLGTQNGTVSSWSDTQIVATVSGTARSAVASVNQNGLYSNTVPFTISTPVIQGISPLSWTPGMQVTITGSGFGATVGNGGVYFVGSGVYGAIVSWSATQVVFTVPSGIGPRSVLVFQNNTNSNSVPYTMAPPVLTGVSPTEWSPGVQVTLTGSGFGPSANGSSGGVYLLGGSYPTIVSWSDTQAVFTVPSEINPGSVLIYQNYVDSNSLSYTMIPPVLTSVSPTVWSSGIQITLTGSGFGSAVGIGGVYFVGTGVYGTVVSWSNTQVVFTVPSGIGSGDVLVFQDGANSNAIAYTMQ